ncbi:hypothetical protein CEP52_017005 [Fusarium oligoseptatum]|uniref:Uncharacterized protein n=1 Tax=Fusarium oligoseptatum TaxID=2604345 RepID=A0A428RXS2_9HYPO|nr:hypothetical protein CEP52_017005 [Fusarium oligoseptatum]
MPLRLGLAFVILFCLAKAIKHIKSLLRFTNSIDSLLLTAAGFIHLLFKTLTKRNNQVAAALRAVQEKGGTTLQGGPQSIVGGLSFNADATVSMRVPTKECNELLLFIFNVVVSCLLCFMHGGYSAFEAGYGQVRSRLGGQCRVKARASSKGSPNHLFEPDGL